MDISLQTSADLHAHILVLLSNQHFDFGNHKSVEISKDCWMIITQVKVLVFEYIECNEDNEVNTQLLYEHINQNLLINSPQNGLYQAIQLKSLAKTTNFFEAIIIPIVQYFAKQWNILAYANVLNNMVDNSQQYTIQCLCDSDQHENQQCSINSSFCYRCGQLFHQKCFNIRQESLFQCPQCFLRYFLPDRQVIKVIFKSYLQPSNQHEKITSIIELNWPLNSYCSQDYSMQLRCFRVGNEYQLTWPESCNIYLDQQLSVCYNPLPAHSPLKRRHDAPLTISLQSLSCSQKIKIEEEYAEVSQWHFIMAVVVKNRREKQIFQHYIQNQYFLISQEQSGKYLNNLFWNGNTGLPVQQLRISGICQYYREKITYPCRSRHCTTHYQPFDLYSFICSSVTAKSSIKRWKCPICGIRAHDIVRDLYLQKLMNSPKKCKQLSFLCNDNNEEKVEALNEEMDLKRRQSQK